MSGNVFIVDDNPANLQLLAGILREAGHTVRMATGARRALAAVRASPPELIMLDITMPEVDGYELCRELKADPVTRELPVIFISALDDVRDKVRAFREGGVDYVGKPFQAEEVLARVDSHLRLARLRRELEQKNKELEQRNRDLERARRAEGAVFSALAASLEGRVLAERYRLEEQIGIGASGAVYRARRLDLDAPVAVKVLRPAAAEVDPMASDRFRREGVSACRVRHPNAVVVIDAGVEQGVVPYLVMELLEGHTLADELKLGAVSVARCAEVGLAVASVLAAAHEAGIVHRDIKPQNIFVHRAGGSSVIKVVDFGIARVGDTDGGVSQLTVTGVVLGTPHYIAPERLDERPYDGRSDVYSLGVVLYQMLAGALPFDGANIAHLFYKVLNTTPAPLRDLRAEVPAPLAEIIECAMAKDPAARPSAAEIVATLREVCGLAADAAPAAVPRSDPPASDPFRRPAPGAGLDGDTAVG